MSELLIIYDKYKFEVELVGTQINFKLTDSELLDLYEASVKEADIYVKPIKKFYAMIEKALCQEPNYSITINDKKTPLVCSFAYNNEMIDIEESISFTKVNTQKTKEVLLVERIKELTELATPVFGYREFGERMIFNIDSKVLDFRPFDDFTRYPNFQDYNKFTKAKKIIMSTASNVFKIIRMTAYCGCQIINFFPESGFCSEAINTDFSPVQCQSQSHHRHLFRIEPHYVINHFNHSSVYLPSVTEVEVYCLPNDNLEAFFTKFKSLPNLGKLSLIQQDNTGFSAAFLNIPGFSAVFFDIHSMISTSPNKKLKHIVLKNMSTWIKPETVDKAKLFAQVNHIKLDII
jgi:hypothetical protein